MYPTWAAAGRRVWRCPACALWIALLLQSVLNVSASGESPNSLSFSPFPGSLLAFRAPSGPPDTRQFMDLTCFTLFGDAVRAFENSIHPQTSAPLKTPLFFPFDCFLRVCLALPNRVCHHSAPLPSSCKSIVVFEIIVFL